jgi:hypothetical protein
MKLYHYFTLLVALTISVCAAYYSIIGLTAIFAAAVVPIIIMGSVLELAKIVGAIWLKIYWQQAGFLLKLYLVPAIGILMFITSMGIFGFLSKAHIEQTASAAEGIAQIERIETEIIRQQDIIARAEARIEEAENSSVESNTNIQSQIDAEQSRIDSAYSRIQPAIDEQLLIIEQARADADSRLQPFRDQLASVEAELLRIEDQAAEIENRIAGLESDNTVVNDLQLQIANIEETITRVSNQLNSNERDQIRIGQAVIGVSGDGVFGGNTRRALATWVAAQQDRIDQLQSQIADARSQAQAGVAAERQRLTDLVTNLRGEQSGRLRERRTNILATINDLQNQDPVAAIAAREEIARIRAGADQQVAASQELIQRLRNSLTVGDDADVQVIIDQQLERIANANNTVDSLTDQRYTLEAQARVLEAEVGPIKYVAELIYGRDAGKDLLEESVRWMILLLVIVFDPLAVILTLAAVTGITGFKNRKKSHKDNTDTVVEQVEVPVEVVREVEVEKIVEVPVEVEKIVEIEVPVEVIREVEIERTVEVENTDKADELAREVEDLLDTIETQKNLIKKLKQDQKVRNQPVAEPDFDLGDVSGASFGSTWPSNPTKGQLFLKVDTLPNKLYKWNGRKWIEVDIARIEDTLAYDLEYIKWLVNEIKHGRREYEELSEIEQSQIKSYVRSHGSNEDVK